MIMVCPPRLLLLLFYPPFVERIGEVFISLYVFFVRSTISQQPVGRFTPNFACGRSLGRDVSSPLLGFSNPRGGGKKRGNDIRMVSFLNRTATISVYLSVTKCGRICRAHTCTHSGWNRKNRPRGFYRVGQKSQKSQFFSRSLRIYVHISQQRLKIEAYKLRNKLYPSPIHPSHVYGPMAHGVSTGWAKK